MAGEPRRFAWKLFTELRRELVELQKIRAQIVGIKITFIGVAISIFAAKLLPGILYTIPAFAAVFFDILIQSYSFGIKRTGFYCREYLEPIFNAEHNLSHEFVYWEKFMDSPVAGMNLAFWGNFGITLLAAAPSLYGLLDRSQHAGIPAFVVYGIFGLLAFMLIFDAWILIKPIQKFVAGKSGFVHRVRPQVGVAVLIVNRQRKVLLGRRKYAPAKGQWDIIGGFVRAGESAEVAAMREAKEETSLELRDVEYLGSFSDVYGDSGRPTLNVCFAAEYAGGKPRPRSDVESLAWRSVDKPPVDMAFPHQRAALELLQDRIAARSAAL